MAAVPATGMSGEVALSAGVAKTVAMVTAPSNHRVKLVGLSIYFKGVVTTDTPAKIELGRCSTAGTPGSSPALTHKREGLPETIQSTFGVNFSVEPTYTEVFDMKEIHPQTGEKYFYPLSQETEIKGGGRLGIRMTAAQAQTVVCIPEIEE